MKHLICTTLLGIAVFFLHAQQHNPLINSKEIIQQAIELHDQGKYSEAITLYKKSPAGRFLLLPGPVRNGVESDAG